MSESHAHTHPRHVEPREALTCSVIVPVYNGAQTIERCLNALAAQTVPPYRYEIIVVDDGSVDDTAAVIRRWRTRHPALRLTLVQQANAGPAAARNHGARLAQAPLLLFTDADCAPLPDWMEALHRAFAADGDGDDGARLAGAKGVYVTAQTGYTPRFVQAEYEDRYDRMRSQPQIDFIDTYSAAYRRDLFLANGGFAAIFPTASVEDQEFSFRLARQGYRMRFVPAARVAHLHDATIVDYGRRKFYIGYWKALLMRWYPERLVQDSHTPQVLKVQMALCTAMLGASLLGWGAFAWKPLRWARRLSLVLLALFLGTTVPFERKLLRRSPQLALVGPFFLVVRALALSAGFLLGAWRFAWGRHVRPWR